MMIFDSLVLAAVSDELTRTVTGGKVERITQPDPMEVVFRIYHAGAKHDIVLCCEAEMARVHLTAVRRENPLQIPSFCGLLRKYLNGAWLTGVVLPLGFAERILHLEFKATDGASYTLVAELMGRHSNVILLSSSGTILGAAKHVTRALNRYRETLPGRPYQPPPPQRGHRDPMKGYEPSISDEPLTPEAGEEWLRGTFAGVSPLLAREVVLRAHSPLTPQSLWYGLNEILSLVRLSEYASRIWTDPQGVLQGAYPIALRSVPMADQHSRDSISLALDQVASSLERNDLYERSQTALRAGLHKALKARKEEQAEILKGLANADRAEQYQQAGDLLMTNQAGIARGQETAIVPDYYGEPAATRTIALDPVLDARENAERYYKKARKARDSRESLESRQAALETEVSTLLVSLSAVENVRTVEEVAALREQVSGQLSRGLSVPQGQGGTHTVRAEPVYEGHKIKTFRSVDGWEILVGENATSNDYLTTRVASPSDIWLHVRASTSAHGVIRAQNRPAAVSPAALQQAAELVAARSEVKHSSLIPVDYTLKKYVRKPRRSAPGAVTYQNEKTLYVGGIHAAARS